MSNVNTILTKAASTALAADHVSPRKLPPAAAKASAARKAPVGGEEAEPAALQQAHFRSDSPPLPTIAKKLGQASQPSKAQSGEPPAHDTPNYYVTESKLNVASPVSQQSTARPSLFCSLFPKNTSGIFSLLVFIPNEVRPRYCEVPNYTFKLKV